MSEYRDPDIVFRISCPKKRQGSQLLQCYSAYQFRGKLRHGSRNCSPPITTNNKEYFLNNLFRVRLNGKWLHKGYVFNTVEEIQKMQISFINGE